MRHVTAIQLCAFMDDALVGSPDDQTARHLATCTPCRIRYELWCHVDDSVRDLFGQVPDEHAMEQWSSWVEIAVTAERKGLPAPEFAAMRLPQMSSPPPPRTVVTPLPAFEAPPFELPPFAAPSPPFAAPLPAAPKPRPAFPPLPAVQPPAPPPAPAAMPYAAEVRVRTSGPVPPVLRGIRPTEMDGPLPFGLDVPHVAPVTPGPYATPVATGAARAPFAAPPQVARPGAYARMPQPPASGFPKLWVWLACALLFAAGTLAALPYVCHRFGWPLPQWPILTAIRNAERDVLARRAEVAGTERAASAPHDATPHDAAPPPVAGKHASSKAHSGEAVQRTDHPGEPPDASIIFDLPAIEPEDAEPDPASDAPSEHASKHETTPHKAVARTGRSGWSQLCGEVRNTQGLPIEGARVSIADPDLIVRTDRHGEFCIACPPGKRTLRILASGRAPVIRTVELGRETLQLRFTLDAAN